MTLQPEFTDQVIDAYAHLYDLQYLRSCPLIKSLIQDTSLSENQKAWQLQRMLLDIIDELKPEPEVPIFSRQWRRHKLMVLRYAKTLSPEDVADQLNISRRHFYREHKIAIETISAVLFDRNAARTSVHQDSAQPAMQQIFPSHLELLRLEAARVTQMDRYADVDDTIAGAVSILQERMKQRMLKLRVSLPESPHEVLIDPSLLRQMFLGILGCIIKNAEHATIHVSGSDEATEMRLSFVVEPQEAIPYARQDDIHKQVALLEGITILTGSHLQTVCTGKRTIGFEVLLPTAQRTVLFLDDNKDILELFQRYLSPHHYRVIATQTAREALDLAHRVHPHIIMLDLMMPDQDGWDVLQHLLNQPDTHHIPIIICSVHTQKDLALSLGATAFLCKPVTEEALLSTLQALDKTR
jgi:CheY-like chemotaxis protein